MKFFKNKKNLLLLALAIVIGYIVYDSASQPTVNDLQGGFREVAMYRNENNTGPIVRVYAVSVQDTLSKDMRQYGDLMPYTKYGTTTVYFFNAAKPFPNSLAAAEPHFDPKFAPGCIAVYRKDANGQVSLGPLP
ncbi:hypothetical protein J2Y45_006576 [Dyadobacter sp. BE34]|uniref:Uncharacterized protein n=1 Tax=Dyadobacter fermentans TaxID=94254 RepID=A0ABU1R8N9_9BACT|nr:MULTISPECIES: hypothetical protein [Dyadobacter]MDR6809567.1 hypothetical protein [Dyadobacter fermentans]MDR7047176.1 hypothetical protein [Dyadobacter sp. BE242]MDR7201412.1 hypothetical protein [Dyadobacter sp. BE34]MDR7219282.1 hypothetical protein [Dyadobacter sp. BE31]MDR7267048.1 hypothetical protein [Dyadobacter sp. BE32]